MNILHKLLKLYLDYKTPILYSGSSFLKSGVQILIGFITARIIVPDDLGLWNTITLGLTYSLFLQGGLINGFNIELPSALGKGDNQKAEVLTGTTLFFTTCTFVITALIGFLYYLFGDFSGDKIKYGVLVVIILIPLSFYQNFLTSTFRSKNAFLKLGYIQIIEAFLNLSTIILVIWFAYYGMIIKILVVTVVNLLMLHFFRPFKVPMQWNYNETIHLMKIGLPIFGLEYLVTLASTFDKILLLQFSDIRSVGLYSFAMYSITFFTIFSLSIATYIYPRMTFAYAKNNDKRALWKYVKKITTLLFSLQLPLVLILLMVIPLAVNNFFPLYKESIIAMQILLVAGLFKGSVIGVNVLWSIKAWKHMFIYQGLYSFLLCFFIYICIKNTSNPLNGAALGVMVANAVNLISGLALSKNATLATT